MKVGQLVRLARRQYKLAIVVSTLERSARAAGKIRVCVWSAESQTWSQPQLVRVGTVEPEREWPDPDPSGRRRRAVIEATAAIRGGMVNYKGGAHVVGQALAIGRTEQAPPPPPADRPLDIAIGTRVLVTGYGMNQRPGVVVDWSLSFARVWIDLVPRDGNKHPLTISLTADEARRIVTIDRKATP